ncbi:MAG: filamentous hemagglutinin N-terminal domain-containing protein [Leptolyngbyaceae cyanobacterium MO_188.B28]|nr:filamentous hemagglutinin N-terminal domain-containing protein [Leptolyngbyaceae cyanobacterium MO_188.B28]
MKIRRTVQLATPGLAGLLLASQAFGVLAGAAYGQIIPDHTLGAESSVVTPRDIVDLIEGGAVRGSALFHSFEDFNVNGGQQVYFANPVGIENILSRVTGFNASQIDGVLGVDGAANLFFLNPNGIIFGPDAQLDVEGAFVASTSDRFRFADGSEFRATDPNAAPLVTVNIPLGLQLGVDAPAALVSEADLAVGGDLTLSAGAVTSTGLLAAPNGEVRVEGVAGDVQVQAVEARSAVLSARGNLVLEESRLVTEGDLSLIAEQTVRIRDSVDTPFLAVSGGDLLLQGNAEVDILALNHLENTPFQSGGDLRLVSDGMVSGDAHFDSGGRFEILDTAGNPGDYVSFFDPVIRAEQDVTFGNYQGRALMVVAAEGIQAGNITINGPDISGLTRDDIPGGAQADLDRLTQNSTLILRSNVGSVNNPNVAENTPQDLTVNTGRTTFRPESGTTINGITVGRIRTRNREGYIELNANGESITLKGNLNSNGGEVRVADGDIRLDQDVQIITGGGDVTLSAVDSANRQNHNLIVNAGSGDVLFDGAVGAAGGGVGTLRINNTGNTTFRDQVVASVVDINGSGDTTFSRQLTAERVNLRHTDGSVTFEGDIDILTGLTIAAEPFDISFSGAENAIAGDTTFRNRGTVALGDVPSDRFEFTGDLNINGASTVDVTGDITANGFSINGGAVDISGDISADAFSVDVSGAVDITGGITADGVSIDARTIDITGNNTAIQVDARSDILLGSRENSFKV